MILYKDILKESKFEMNYYDMNDDEDVEKIKSIFLMYEGKRAKSNYSEESINHLVKIKRYFGGLALKINDAVVAACVLCNKNDWIVISRFVKLSKRSRIPYASGIFIPYIERNLLKDKKGIVMTFNDYNKVYYEQYSQKTIDTFENSESFKEVKDHIFIKNTIDIIKRVKKLPEQIDYNYTKQWVIYLTDTSLIPFE